jgi:hypothetical protein
VRDERRTIGIGGPITMIAIGGGVALFGSMLTLMAVGAKATCRDLNDSDFDFGHEDCSRYDGPALGFGLVALGGLALGLGGVATLTDRVSERRELARRMRELEAQKVDLEQQRTLSYDLHVTDHSVMATLGGHF